MCIKSDTPHKIGIWTVIRQTLSPSAQRTENYPEMFWNLRGRQFIFWWVFQVCWAKLRFYQPGLLCCHLISTIWYHSRVKWMSLVYFAPLNMIWQKNDTELNENSNMISREEMHKTFILLSCCENWNPAKKTPLTLTLVESMPSYFVISFQRKGCKQRKRRKGSTEWCSVNFRSICELCGTRLWEWRKSEDTRELRATGALQVW